MVVDVFIFDIQFVEICRIVGQIGDVDIQIQVFCYCFGVGIVVWIGQQVVDLQVGFFDRFVQGGGFGGFVGIDVVCYCFVKLWLQIVVCGGICMELVDQYDLVVDGILWQYYCCIV